MVENKPIIIDDIDVSGCKFYKGYCRIASLCDYPGHLCEVTPNCYYKQLKRKEQECEGLEYDYQYQLKNTKKWIVECENLQQQLDQLKAEIDKKELIFAGIETSNRLLIEKNNKLKQTLIEIKEYCTDLKKDHYWGMRIIRFTNKILQKISEVENEYRTKRTIN